MKEITIKLDELHSGIMDCPIGQMSIEDFLEANVQ